MSVWTSVVFRIVIPCMVMLSPAGYHAYAEDTTVIVFFGDSIVAGYGLKSEEAPPAQLEALLQQKHPNIQVVNAGVSGDTTAGGRSRLEWTLDKHKPDMVIIALGGNDVLRGLPPQTTRENLIAMLDVLKQRGIPAILSAVQAPDSLGESYTTAFNGIYVDAAKHYALPLYPFLLSETYGKQGLMQEDGIHPTAKGAARIAHGLANYLQQMQLLSPRPKS